MINDDLLKSKSDLLFRTGVSLSRKGNIVVAINAYRRVLSLVPNHAGASMQLAGALASQGQVVESCDILHAITQARPDDLNAQYRLGLTLAKLGDHAAAERAFSRVLELAPTHSGAPIHRSAALRHMQRAATNLEREGRFPEALELLRAIADAKPDDAAAYYRLGLALARSGDDDGAAEAFTRVLDIAPEHPTASIQRAAALSRMRRLATVLERNGKVLEAIPFLRAVAKSMPDDAAAHYRLGLALARMSNFVEAEISLARVLQLDPQYEKATVHHAAMVVNMLRVAARLERQGNFTEAVSLLDAIAKIKPTDTGIAYRIGLALARSGDPAGAEAAFARVLALDPDHSGAQTHHAAALDRMGRLSTALERKGCFSEAARLLRKLTIAKPDEVKFLEDLARVLKRSDNNVATVTAPGRQLEQDPDFAKRAMIGLGEPPDFPGPVDGNPAKVQVRRQLFEVKDTTANVYHVVLVTDSLSLPRPWRQTDKLGLGDGSVRYIESYPYLLKRRLRQHVPNKDVEVSNFATRASTLTSVWSHRLELFSWMEADVAVIHRGVVDCWPRADNGSKPRIPLDKFEADYVRLLDEREKLESAAKLIVVGISPTNALALAKDPSTNDLIRSYNEVFKRHMRNGMYFLDMEKVAAKHGGATIHPDGHHLSGLGHVVLAQELESVIFGMGLPD